MLAVHAAHLAVLEPDAGDWEDDELRRFRVAARRLRALLRAARPLVDESWARRLREELAWLARGAGEARDLDVLLAGLREAAAHFEIGERFLLARPLQQLERERTAARAAFVQTLRSERAIRLIACLELDVADAPAGTGAPVALDEIAAAAFGRLRKCARRLDREAADADLHRLRLAVKRARYAAELAAEETGKPGARFVERAKSLQDVLGEHQDATVAEVRLRQLLGSREGSRWAVPGGRFIEHQYLRRQAARTAWPGAWWELEKAGRAAFGQTLKRMLSTSPSATA